MSLESLLRGVINHGKPRTLIAVEDCASVCVAAHYFSMKLKGMDEEKLIEIGKGFIEEQIRTMMEAAGIPRHFTLDKLTPEHVKLVLLFTSKEIVRHLETDYTKEIK